MKIIKGLKSLKAITGDSVVTIGVFDGVHRGHEKIIKDVVSRARKARASSIVITFDPHPVKALDHAASTPSLVSTKHRIRLIGELGVDILTIVKFTRSFARMSAERFVKNILVGKFHMKHIFVGENFYFGAGAGSGIETLKKFADKYGFKVTEVRPVKRLGRVVSSSLIRRLILEGKLREASNLLGRPVSVLGTVVKGSGIARGLGCPTANINPHHEVIPPRGVYAVMARLGRKEYRAILNIGFRPTFYSSRDEEPTVEVHLFGFRGNIYSRDIEVYFVKKIRDEVKFKSGAMLVSQIKDDMDAARRILSL